MKPLVTIAIVSILIATGAHAATNSTALVQLHSKDFGDTNSFMKLVELERGTNTSKLKLTYEKRGSSVGSAMFIARGFYDVAKARGAEYFINLKEWDDKNGGTIYIAGFTNKKDADVKNEFGQQFDYNNEEGDKRAYMSVSELKRLFDKAEKSAATPPANGSPSP